MDRGAWQTTVHGVSKNQTGLKGLCLCACTHTHTHSHTKLKFNFTFETMEVKKRGDIISQVLKEKKNYSQSILYLTKLNIQK